MAGPAVSMEMEPSLHTPSGYPHAVRRLVGKLLGVRADVLRSKNDVATLAARFSEHFERSRGSVVVCTDYRHLRVVSEDDLASAVIPCPWPSNPRVLRSALILPRAATLRLRLSRALPAGQDARWRACADTAEAKAWLNSELEPAERLGLDGFLRSVG
jgi:hypothetical protein